MTADWRQQAVCRDLPHFTDDDNQDTARLFCAGCPVQNACLNYALSIHTLEQARALDGVVWGGRTGRELAALIRRRQRNARERAVAA